MDRMHVHILIYVIIHIQVMLDPDRIKKALVVDDKKLQEELLERVAVHLRIDSQGRVHLNDPTRYKLKDAVALYLVGRSYAFGAGLVKEDSATLSEISSSLGAKTQVVSARLSELRNEGKVEALKRGESRIVLARVPQVLSEIDGQVRAWGRKESQ